MSSNQDIITPAREFFTGNVAGSSEGRQRLRRHDQIVQFTVTDGASFIVMVKEGKCILKRGHIKNPKINIEASIDTYRAIFEGKLTLTDAWFNKKLKLNGIQRWREDYIWFLPLIRIGQGKYFWAE